MARKTNALRILDRAGIRYDAREYDLAMEDFSAEAVAALIDLDPAEVFKTLVTEGDRNGHAFAVIPANEELDLKALAAVRGDRKTGLIAVKDVEPLTGYRRGGVTAIGARRTLPVVLDASAGALPTIAVSGGAKGIQVVLATDDYIAETGATLAPIARR
jgi:Cys-tRNA(Pro)/Cys-tRNA(Cys) deacylase